MNDRDDFALKRALDALPRSIEPPEDLWPGVRGRLRRPAAAGWRRRPAAWRLAAGLVLLAGVLGVYVRQRARETTWRVAVAAGAPARVLRVGETIETADSGRALLDVATIGQVEVEGGTRVRLLAARRTEHRLALDRGTIHARISAPPRLFFVETPSGTAVDLGCAYTLEVDSAGNSVIHVTLGWVSFEDHGRESLIPGGMSAAARRGAGIGTPVMDDAPAALRAAVADFDGGGGSDAALARILEVARPRDAVTLWHLVKRTRGEARARAFTRLAALVPPPEELRAGGALLDDPRMMELWWVKLPGTLPIVSDWQRRLWLLWLRVFG